MFPTTSLLSHKHVALLLSKMPCLCPLPQPPRCALILRNIRSRGGARLLYLQSSPAALSGGPALTFPLSPGYGQSPLGEQTPVCSSLPRSGVLFQGQWLTCQLLHHSFFPPQGPPPISFSQAINLETEIGLLSILWPLFFLLHFVLWFYSSFCACVFVSLNVEATRSLVLFCDSFWRKKGGA